MLVWMEGNYDLGICCLADLAKRGSADAIQWLQGLSLSSPERVKSLMMTHLGGEAEWLIDTWGIHRHLSVDGIMGVIEAPFFARQFNTYRGHEYLGLRRRFRR